MQTPCMQRRWVQPWNWQSALVMQMQGQPVLVHTPLRHLVRGQQLRTAIQSVSSLQDEGQRTPVRAWQMPRMQKR